MSTTGKISAVIIEDEGKSAQVLQKMLLQSFPGMDIQGTAGRTRDAFHLLQQAAPDIAFIDVELADGNAFDLLQLLEHIPFRIIFTTAYDHYALKAIKIHAADYLLKPVSETELKAAVNRVLTGDGLPDLQREQLKQTAMNNRISIPATGGILFVDTDDIIHCRAEGSYTTLFLQQAPRITTSKNLGEFEQVLPPHFFRVHKSHIVNLRHIHKYIQGRGGWIIMKDGTEIEVSARRKDDFLNLFR